jgi:hypothetical protein
LWRRSRLKLKCGAKERRRRRRRRRKLIIWKWGIMAYLMKDLEFERL